jgi:hypothetical protein
MCSSGYTRIVPCEAAPHEGFDTLDLREAKALLGELHD